MISPEKKIWDIKFMKIQKIILKIVTFEKIDKITKMNKIRINSFN